MAFDTSSSEGFCDNTDIFVTVCFGHQNCIKFYVYDYFFNVVRPVYEIPIKPKKIRKIFDIQLTRISEDLTYAVMLDYAESKEIIFVSFTRTNPKTTIAPGYKIFEIKGEMLEII